jgi:hypothetical protein
VNTKQKKIIDFAIMEKKSHVKGSVMLGAFSSFIISPNLSQRNETESENNDYSLESRVVPLFQNKSYLIVDSQE